LHQHGIQLPRWAAEQAAGAPSPPDNTYTTFTGALVDPLAVTAVRGDKSDTSILGLHLFLQRFQVGEDNYETAMEFCAGNLNPKYHRYKDVNPREVRELYAG